MIGLRFLSDGSLCVLTQIGSVEALVERPMAATAEMRRLCRNDPVYWDKTATTVRLLLIDESDPVRVPWEILPDLSVRRIDAQDPLWASYFFSSLFRGQLGYNPEEHPRAMITSLELEAHEVASVQLDNVEADALQKAWEAKHGKTEFESRRYDVFVTRDGFLTTLTHLTGKTQESFFLRALPSPVRFNDDDIPPIDSRTPVASPLPGASWTLGPNRNNRYLGGDLENAARLGREAAHGENAGGQDATSFFQEQLEREATFDEDNAFWAAYRSAGGKNEP